MDSKPTASTMGISFVFPCLNEEATVGDCVREALESAAALNIPADVTVVDNGSIDKSVLMAQQAGANVLLYPSKGYGAALQVGIIAARFSYIITADSDGQHKLTIPNIKAIFDLLIKGADFVNGNRFHPVNSAYQVPLERNIGNRVFSLFFNFLYGTHLHDVTCGMNGFNASFLKTLPFRSTGMEFSIEVRALNVLHHAIIQEVNLECGNRLGGYSHVRLLRDGLLHLWTIFRIRIIYWRQKLYVNSRSGQ